MAQRNILDLYTSQPITTLEGTDLIHIGRPGEAAAGDRDKGMLASDFYNAVNAVVGVFGVQSQQTATIIIPEVVTGYAAGVGVGANEAAGTITLPQSGVTKLEMSSIVEADDDNVQFEIWLGINGVANVLIDAIDRPNNSVAPYYYTLSGTKVINITGGNALSVMISSSTIRGITWLDAMLMATPLFIA